MKLLFDGTIFGLQRVGGISTYAWEIVRRLAETRDIELTLELPRTVLSDRAKAIAALPAQRRRATIPVKVGRYLPLAGGRDADVVHSAYYRLSANPRARRVVTVYDFVYERYRRGLARAVHSDQKRRAVTRADVVLCISENTRRDLLAAYRDVDPAKVRVTPLAADDETFFVPPIARSDLQDAVVFVGQRKGYKRFDLAVEGAALAGLRLGVVGPAPDPAEHAWLDTRLPGRWLALGRVSNAELRGIYAGALAFIYPSDYEGFGLPILEAQACGCPVVIADRSSFPEVGGPEAMFASDQTPEAYGAALSRLLDSERRSAAIAAGIANAARFSWAKCFALTLDAYRDVQR